jgi:hypothetical protein
MHSPSIMVQPQILHNSSLLTPTTPYTCVGQRPMAQVSTFEKREVVSMV